jgi:glycosyltransferase involved in cell wall biosynthesis
MGQYASRLLTELPGLGADLEVVAYGAIGEERPSWLPAEVVWRPMPDAPVGVPRVAAALWSRLHDLPRLVERDRLDLFHVPAVHVRPSFPPIPMLEVPTVVTVHDLIPLTHYGPELPWRLRAFYRWNLERALRATIVITVSNAAAADLRRLAPELGGRLHVVPNGVNFAPNPDIEPLSRLGVTPPYLLYAGSYEPRKNLVGMLAALQLLKQAYSGIVVAVVEAHSGHEPAVHAAIAAAGLQDRVRLVHSLAEPDLRSLYSHAQALVFPSLAEGFGYPPLQAAACGVPVVASDLPAVREVMADAALYFDPRSSEALCFAMRRMFNDGPLRRGMVARGLQRAAMFSSSRSIAGHLALYRSCAANAIRQVAS